MVCVLLLPVCDLVLQGQVLQGHDLVLRGQGRYSWKVVVSGLLFAVHPVHSESVSFVFLLKINEMHLDNYPFRNCHIYVVHEFNSMKLNQKCIE